MWQASSFAILYVAGVKLCYPLCGRRQALLSFIWQASSFAILYLAGVKLAAPMKVSANRREIPRIIRQIPKMLE
jgi:hypothetical protein